MKYSLSSFAISLTLSSASFAQIAAFTYQGELKTGNQLASGLHDFRFRLFDSSTSSTQIGPVLCIDNVAVSDGKFSTMLDFGAQFNTRDARFLELEVRRDAGLDCSNSSGFVAMGPRQLLSAAPLAQHARTAFALDAPDGSPLGAVFVKDNGAVGIGTTDSLNSSSLHIRWSDPVVVLQDSGPDAAQSGYLGFWNNQNSETGWIGFGSPGSPVFSIRNARVGGHITFLPSSSGLANIGIGTSAPLAKLEVRGDIRMGASGQQFAMRAEENLRMIRGSIGVFGDRLRGTGFTSEDLDLGKYRITFDTPFPSIPAITVTPRRSVFDGAMTASLESVSTSSATIVIWGMDLGRFVYRDFDFLVVGPR